MTTISKHWASDLIGKRWEAGAKGPEAFDCWTLVVFVYQEMKGIELSDYMKVSRDATIAEVRGFQSIIQKGHDWNRIQEPEEFFLVLLSNQNSNLPHHCGLWTEADGGKVVHARRGIGVLAEKVQRMKKQWNIVGFYKYNGDNH